MEIQDGTLGLTDLLEVLEVISLVLVVPQARQHVPLALALPAGERGLLVSILVSPGLASQSNLALVIVAGFILIQAFHASRDIKAEGFSACLSDPHEGWTVIHLWAPMVLEQLVLIKELELAGIPNILLSKLSHLAVGNSYQ